LLNDNEPENKFSRVSLDFPGQENNRFWFSLSPRTRTLFVDWASIRFDAPSAGGSTITYKIEPDSENETVRTLAIDQQNRIWLTSAIAVW
jgi:hypothetical protein